eukprot:236458_1
MMNDTLVLYDNIDYAVFVSYPINKIHLFSDFKQFQLVENGINSFEVIQMNQNCPFKDADIIYIESLHKLFAMNCKNDEWRVDGKCRCNGECNCGLMDSMYFCDVTTNQWQWKKSMKFPNEEVRGRTEALIANIGHILFVFNWSNDLFIDTIYSIDLWTEKVWSTEVRFPMKLGEMRRGHGGDRGNLYEFLPNKCVVNGENEIHFFEIYMAQHYKISLNDVIPSSLIRYYNVLIHGYIRRIKGVNHDNVKDLISTISHHLILFNV